MKRISGMDPALREILWQERKFKRQALAEGLKAGTPAFDNFVQESFDAENDYNRLVSEAMSCGMA